MQSTLKQEDGTMDRYAITNSFGLLFCLQQHFLLSLFASLTGMPIYMKTV